MKIFNIDQRSEEWYSVRCGIPTSSNFNKVVTSAGKTSKQQQKYIYKLAGERMTGVPDDVYQNGAMIRGQELEEEARLLYEVLNEVEVKEVGFCLVDGEFKYGASPDGLIADDGGLQIKCPSLAVHIEYLLKGVLPTDYIQQVKGEMLVTGRAWIDFMSYYPGVKPLIVRVQRDDSFNELLKHELEECCKSIDKIVDVIESKN